MKIFLTGRGGQVGSALLPLLARLGEVSASDQGDLDLHDPEAITRRVAQERPAIIVNTAAYTAVDRAESEADAAFAINAAAAGALARAARKLDALLVHFSTDFVYDGEKPARYVETDPAHPLSVYGRSKLEGDRLVAASGCRHFIFRTSWVYSAGGRNFLLAILSAARSKPELRVVADQRGAPTSSGAIAAAVAQIVGDAALRAKPPGVYHLTAGGETTWHGFAQAIVEGAGLNTPVLAIRSDEYPAAAKRPKNSLLDNAKAAATFGLALPDWRDGFRNVLQAMH